MITFNSSCIKKEKFQRHAVRKFTTLLAVSTTIFLLCVKNVKAFAAPLSSPALLNENTLMFLATGAHSIAKRWKTTGRSSSSILETQKMLPIQIKAVFVPHPFAKSHRTSLTSLTMAFGFGVPSPSTPAPPMLDMKTSINAFGSWYNSMDPVARPPVYDDEVTDYSFSSPADSWPSSFEDDAVMTNVSKSFVGVPRASKLAATKTRLPRPIRTLRKIAGWVFRSPEGRNARGFGTNTLL